MKIKMLEYFQGTGQPTLVIDNEYESKDIGQKLCDWLIEHGKAKDITPPPPPPKPEPKPEPEPEKEKAAARPRRTTRGRSKKTDAED